MTIRKYAGWAFHAALDHRTAIAVGMWLSAFAMTLTFCFFDVPSAVRTVAAVLGVTPFAVAIVLDFALDPEPRTRKRISR